MRSSERDLDYHCEEGNRMSCFPFIAAGREFEGINFRLALLLLLLPPPLSPFSFLRGTTLSSSMRVKRDQISSINPGSGTSKVAVVFIQTPEGKIKNEGKAPSSIIKDLVLCSDFLIVLDQQ